MRLKIKVPATSANLGAGFDCFGLALSLYNTFEVCEILPAGEYRVEVNGEGKGQLEKSNFFIESFEAAMREWGIEPRGLDIKMKNEVPLRRGLGSSSTAIVAGVMVANEFREKPLEKHELLPLMTALEGHPDNVVPACTGGFVVSSWDGASLKGATLQFVKMPRMPENLRAVVIVPEQELETRAARSVLPKNISMSDAVFNISRASLFAAAWATGDIGKLKFAMDDRLHQPYRAPLIAGCREVLETAKNLDGCLGAAISGSGSSILVLAQAAEAKNVGEAICEIFASSGNSARAIILEEDGDGAYFI